MGRRDPAGLGIARCSGRGRRGRRRTGRAPSADDRDVWGAPARSELGAGLPRRAGVRRADLVAQPGYSPDTRGFLSPDPLPGVPGTAWSGNPYHYAGNDPVGHADPLGPAPGHRRGAARLSRRDGPERLGEDDRLGRGELGVPGGRSHDRRRRGPDVHGGGRACRDRVDGGVRSDGLGRGKRRRSEVHHRRRRLGPGRRGRTYRRCVRRRGGAAGMALGRGAFLATTSPTLRGAVGGGLSGVVSGMVGRGVAGEDPFDPRGLATDLLIGGAAGAVGGRLGAGHGGDPELVPDPPEVPPFIYRGGGTSPGNFRLRPGEEALSFRDSLSDPLPPAKPVFNKSEYVEVDTSKLPPGSVVPDGVVGSAETPPGHVSVYVDDPEILKEAAVKFKFPK